jgi:cell division protein FtsB
MCVMRLDGHGADELVLNHPLTRRTHRARMVTRTRLRAVLTALGLYTVAALIIGYFGLSAYTGAHGLKAKQDLAQQQANLLRELERVRAERKQWEHRVSLLRADRLDPDMLDERARVMLNYVHPRDLVLSLKR